MQWSQNLNLKFCLLNAENLFLMLDQKQSPDLKQNLAKLKETQWQKLSSSVYENKSLKKALELAQCIQEIKADIYMLCEVGGLESLKNFNELFLNDEFAPCLLEGNSDRNIDVGFLVRKTNNFYFDIFSNKNRLINFLYPHEKLSLQNGYPIKNGKVLQSHKFSRDVAELRLFTLDKEKPFLIILLTHLKSRLDPDHIDPNGFERRQAELNTLIEIYQELKNQYSSASFIVAGDFNGNASSQNTDEEFKNLYTTDLQDVLDLAGVPFTERATFFQVRNAGKADGRQIDFAFLSEQLKKHLKPQSSFVYRYKDEFGMVYDTPGSLDAKMRLPSDHYPVVFELINLKS